MLTIGDASLGADIVRFEITGASMAETELDISRVALHAVINPPSVIILVNSVSEVAPCSH